MPKKVLIGKIRCRDLFCTYTALHFMTGRVVKSIHFVLSQFNYFSHAFYARASGSDTEGKLHRLGIK